MSGGLMSGGLMSGVNDSILTRPFRFGLQLSVPLPGTTWMETARRVEQAGFSSLVVPDHFTDQLGPIAAMTAAAVATTELRVGCLVFDNDYRHPAVLAKEIASVESFAPGRVEFGLGAGWMSWDYEAVGMERDEPRVRVDRFEEGLEVCRRLFEGGEVDFDGAHYRLAGLPGTPTLRSGPLIMVGGGGPRMLGIAARQADIVAVTGRIPSGRVDLDAARDIAPAAVDRKIGWVRSAAGNRLADIELNCLVFLARITDDAEEVAAGVASMFGEDTAVAHGVGRSLRAAADGGGEESAPAGASQEADPQRDVFGAADVLASPAVLLGSLGEMADLLHERRDRWGFSYVVFQGEDSFELEPLVASLSGR